MKSIEEQLEDYKKMAEAKNAFISGLVMGWVHQLESGSMIDKIRIIGDMKEFSEKLADILGYKIKNEVAESRVTLLSK